LNSPVTRDFFATVQNKFHFAIHGHTAAEIVVQRASAAKPNMGLTTWKNAPGGPIRKSDVSNQRAVDRRAASMGRAKGIAPCESDSPFPQKTHRALQNTIS
jgi:hypothetical protein